jgi:hypothetical protein
MRIRGGALAEWQLKLQKEATEKAAEKKATGRATELAAEKARRAQVSEFIKGSKGPSKGAASAGPGGGGGWPGAASAGPGGGRQSASAGAGGGGLGAASAGPGGGGSGSKSIMKDGWKESNYRFPLVLNDDDGQHTPVFNEFLKKHFNTASEFVEALSTLVFRGLTPEKKRRLKTIFDYTLRFELIGLAQFGSGDKAGLASFHRGNFQTQSASDMANREIVSIWRRKFAEEYSCLRKDDRDDVLFQRPDKDTASSFWLLDIDDKTKGIIGKVVQIQGKLVTGAHAPQEKEGALVVMFAKILNPDCAKYFDVYDSQVSVSVTSSRVNSVDYYFTSDKNATVLLYQYAKLDYLDQKYPGFIDCISETLQVHGQTIIDSVMVFEGSLLSATIGCEKSKKETPSKQENPEQASRGRPKTGPKVSTTASIGPGNPCSVAYQELRLPGNQRQLNDAAIGSLLTTYASSDKTLLTQMISLTRAIKVEYPDKEHPLSFYGARNRYLTVGFPVDIRGFYKQPERIGMIRLQYGFRHDMSDYMYKLTQDPKMKEEAKLVLEIEEKTNKVVSNLSKYISDNVRAYKEKKGLAKSYPLDMESAIDIYKGLFESYRPLALDIEHMALRSQKAFTIGENGVAKQNMNLNALSGGEGDAQLKPTFQTDEDLQIIKAIRAISGGKNSLFSSVEQSVAFIRAISDGTLVQDEKDPHLYYYNDKASVTPDDEKPNFSQINIEKIRVILQNAGIQVGPQNGPFEPFDTLRIPKKYLDQIRSLSLTSVQSTFSFTQIEVKEILGKLVSVAKNLEDLKDSFAIESIMNEYLEKYNEPTATKKRGLNDLHQFTGAFRYSLFRTCLECIPVAEKMFLEKEKMSNKFFMRARRSGRAASGSALGAASSSASRPGMED